MYTGHNRNRKLRPTSKNKKRNEVTGGMQDTPVRVGWEGHEEVGMPLRMILVPGRSQEHAHSCL